jgi:hypothetical protein
MATHEGVLLTRDEEYRDSAILYSRDEVKLREIEVRFVFDG